MCGIAGIYLKDPKILKNHNELERFVNVMFKGIEDRGKHASGFVACTAAGKVVVDKAAKSASEFIKDREAIPEGARTILLHTRYATKGGVENHQNNHPVISRTCFVTHNGSVENDDDLFKEHALPRHAEVDSEAIAAMLSEFGLDDVQKTMEALEGPVAIAAIDPINSPNKLLLAKGVSSPLVYYDAGKFVIWASTAVTLKIAWASVFGTPPSEKKFKYMAQGDAIIFEDFKRTDEKFTPPSWMKDYSRHASQRESWVPQAGFGYSGSYKDVPKYLKGVIQARREANEGKARTFHEYNQGQYPELQDSKHNAWVTCLGCTMQVISMDMRYTTGYGRLCLDCDVATKDIDARKTAEAARKKVEAATQQQQLLLPEARRTCRAMLAEAGVKQEALNKMTRYAQMEATIHQEALRNLEKRTGFDYDLLDFMLHRALLDVVERDSSWNALFLELEEAYSVELDVQWAQLSTDDDDRDSWEDIIGKNVQQVKESASCDLNTAERKDEPDVLDYAECDRCGTYTWPGERRCTVCLERDRLVAEAKEPMIEPVIPVKCEKCKSKPTGAISNESVGLGWCDKHLNTCTVRGCRKMPVGFTFDGEWLCHAHSRKVKGLMTIKTAQDRGYVYTTIGGSK